MSPLTARATLLLVFASAVAAGNARAAGEGKACADAAEHAESLRHDGHLLAALDEIPVCVRPVCPDFVRADCAKWQGEIDAAVPTFVVRARTEAGADLTAVKVTADGYVLAGALDGLAKRLDPGRHVLRFESAGMEPVEQTVVLREGEKMRPVEVVLRARGGEQPASRGVPAGAWILGAVGLVAVGAGGVLAATSLSDYDALKKGCGQLGTCPSGDVDWARTRMWLGDGLLVAGAVALGAAVWIALAAKPPPRVGLLPNGFVF